MIDKGEILVIDDFIDKNYQEKIKDNLWEKIMIFISLALY